MKIEIEITDGLAEMIQRLAGQMFGEDATRDSVADNLPLLLPDLVGNALAGDILPESERQVGDPDLEEALQFGPGEDAPDPDLRAAVEAAEREMSDPKVQMPTLDVHPSGPVMVEPEPLPSFEEISKDKRIHPDVVAWAKGHPGKEAAMVETLLGLHPNLWELSQVMKMCERTFDARSAGNDV